MKFKDNLCSLARIAESRQSPKIPMQSNPFKSMMFILLLGFVGMCHCQYGDNPSYGYRNYENNIVSIEYVSVSPLHDSCTLRLKYIWKWLYIKCFYSI